jgi:hypothetical protein
MVRPGKFVLISDELVEKSARATLDSHRFTREEVERIAAAEPRGATVFAGPFHPTRRQVKLGLWRLSLDEASAHQRVALKVRQMLGIATVNASAFDIDTWVVEWIKTPLPQLDGKTPAETMRLHGGWESVEAALDNMSGGLPG